jgi:hypothetical protein
MRACGVDGVARDETAKDKVEGEEDNRGERGEIRGASLVQDLSGMLSVREVESESAAIARGLDLLSKILVSDSGCLGASGVGERVAGAHQEREWGRNGSLVMRSVYARRPMRIAKCRRWLVSQTRRIGARAHRVAISCRAPTSSDRLAACAIAPNCLWAFPSRYGKVAAPSGACSRV